MNIALIDSHQIFTEALKAKLMHSLPDSTFAGHYNSIESFIAAHAGHEPTIVITELYFNGRQDRGLDALFRLDERVKVIILTSVTDPQLIRGYMKQGARAFLTKTCLFQELLDAIAQVQKGNLFLSDDVQNLLLTGMISEWSSASDLSTIERSILEGLARDEPFKSIAIRLGISMIEFKYHRKMIMSRFDLKRFTDLTDLAKKPGFLRNRAVDAKAAIPGRPKPAARARHKEPAMSM